MSTIFIANIWTVHCAVVLPMSNEISDKCAIFNGVWFLNWDTHITQVVRASIFFFWNEIFWNNRAQNLSLSFDLVRPVSSCEKNSFIILSRFELRICISRLETVWAVYWFLFRGTLFSSQEAEGKVVSWCTNLCIARRFLFQIRRPNNLICKW